MAGDHNVLALCADWPHVPAVGCATVEPLEAERAEPGNLSNPKDGPAKHVGRVLFSRIFVTSQFKTSKLSTNTKSKPQQGPSRRTEIWRPEVSSLTRDELRAIVLRTIG